MGRLPVVSGREAAKVFLKIGFVQHHGRGKGSHIVLVRRSVPPVTLLTIPDHKTLRRGTLRALIRDAGLSVQEFTRLL